MFLKSFDWFLQQVIKFFRTIYDKQRKIYITQNTPAFRNKSSFIVCEPRCIKVLQLNIFDSFICLNLKRLESMKYFISSISFGRDCSNLVA